MSSNASSIGGTSGNPAATSNMLSLNLGGVNLSYDLGPNVSALSSQADQFVSQSFGADTALLNGAIIGGQTFLGNVSNPIIALAQNQQKFNTTQLPAMFSTLNNQNFQIGSAAIAAETQVANAQIAQANATAQSAGGGGCYITTAVCGTLGLADDCEALRILRKFRDRYMHASEERRALVREYYSTAPAIAARIAASPNAQAIASNLYADFIHPAIVNIRRGYYARALTIYRAMIEAARHV